VFGNAGAAIEDGDGDRAVAVLAEFDFGGALARTAWGGFMQAARTLAEGRFDGFVGAAPGDELNAFFRAPAAR
jgi:hypothetical protein